MQVREAAAEGEVTAVGKELEMEEWMVDESGRVAEGLACEHTEGGRGCISEKTTPGQFRGRGAKGVCVNTSESSSRGKTGTLDSLDSLP